MSIAIFKTFIEAVQHVVQKHGINYFTITDVAYRARGRIDAMTDIDEVAQNTGYAITPEYVSTMAALDMDEDTVAVVEIEAEAHYGYVVCHYEKDGTPIKFIGVRCN